MWSNFFWASDEILTVMLPVFCAIDNHSDDNILQVNYNTPPHVMTASFPGPSAQKSPVISQKKTPAYSLTIATSR